MEIDVLAVLIINWACCLGWKRRGLNALMDFMAIAVVGIVLSDVIPLSQRFVISQELKMSLIHWIQYHLNATTPTSAMYFHVLHDIPVGTGMYKRDITVLQNIYEYSMTFVIGITLFISIQMVRRSFMTIWPPRHGLWDSNVAGTIISGLLGFYIFLYCVALLGLMTWFIGFGWLDQSLQHSFFIRILNAYNPW